MILGEWGPQQSGPETMTSGRGGGTVWAADFRRQELGKGLETPIIYAALPLRVLSMPNPLPNGLLAHNAYIYAPDSLYTQYKIKLKHFHSPLHGLWPLPVQNV